MAKPILTNVTEEIVLGLVKFLLQGPGFQTFCHCDDCQMTICSEALNNLPTYYVSSNEAREEAFAALKTPEQLEIVNKKIIVAIHTVGKRGNHKK